MHRYNIFEPSRLIRLTGAIGLGIAAAATPFRADAQTVAPETPIEALKQLSVEDLMNIEVTSVSKQPEKLLDAASAIQVITDDDIERSGASSIPEALRLADNLDVTQKDANDWGISARGFNTNLADKLLVLIDGRAVYSPLYGGVQWNVQDYLLEDIDRIEVISGPGGTLWGANAVNGVINITTKSAKDTQGTYLEEAAGTQLEDQTAVRFGGTLSPNVYFRVYAEYSQTGSDVFSNGDSAGDSLRMGRTGFRIDSDAYSQNTLTLQGDYYNGVQDLGATGKGALSGGNLLGRWSHTFSDDSDVSLQMYYDQTFLSNPEPADSPSPPYFSGFPASALTDHLDTYDLDFQRHFRLGEQNQIIWGLGYRFTHETDEDLSLIRFTPPTLDQSLYSGFIQDEIDVVENVRFTLGTKLEHNSYTGYEFEPNGRLQWNFTPKQMLWTAVSRAVRTPSRYDRDLEVVTGLENAPAGFKFPTDYLDGSDSFISENVIAYELGYRAEIGLKASLSVSTFYNDYNDVRSATSTPTTAVYVFPFPVVFQNNLEGHTYGAEVSANYQLLSWWRLHAGYDLLREDIFVKPGQTDATGALNETADPRNQFSLRSSMDLPHTVELDAALRWVDKLVLDDGPTDGPVSGTVPSYFELDVHLGWHPTKRMEISLVGQNLLHAHHPEYGFPSAAREEVVRGAYAKAEWRY
jgi:iron complex outermembrane recepter protein